MNTPGNLKYTKDHEWVLVSGTIARVGITDYAQEALGDIVYIQLPQVGATVAVNDSIAEIESTKSVNDVYAPLTGEIVAVNPLLGDRPELVNQDPYGEGWLFDVSVGSLDEGTLMSADEYQSLVEG